MSMRGIGYHAAVWRHPSVPPGAALTLRENLGLKRPVSRHQRAIQSAAAE